MPIKRKGTWYKIIGADGKFLRRLKLTSTEVAVLRKRFPKSTFKRM